MMRGWKGVVELRRREGGKTVDWKVVDDEEGRIEFAPSNFFNENFLTGRITPPPTPLRPPKIPSLPT